MQYGYRLESVWTQWDKYFETDGHRYVGARSVDLIERHGLVCNKTCGLWMLTAFDDAVRFQRTEPHFEMNDKKANAINCLNGDGDPNRCLRFCTRISTDAFNGNVFPDIPLVGEYASSVFHARFAGEGDVYRPGRLVDGERLDDRFIEIFFAGRWHQKSPLLGQALRNRIIMDQSVDGVLLGLASETCPSGHVDQIA
jgi:hypothetical protein